MFFAALKSGGRKHLIEEGKIVPESELYDSSVTKHIPKMIDPIPC